MEYSSWIFGVLALVSLVSSAAVNGPVPYLDELKQSDEKVQMQILESTNSVLQNIATYDSYMKNMSDTILAEQLATIHNRVTDMKTKLGLNIQRRSLQSSSNHENLLLKCAIDEGILDRLAQEVNEEIKTCATVAMAETSNVISTSLNDAQSFMTLPKLIGSDIQRCGLSPSCRWDIVQHSIFEALQVPPKVFALTAKVQSLVLKTVTSIDSCGLKGLRNIGETGIQIMQDVFNCIQDELTVASNKANP